MADRNKHLVAGKRLPNRKIRETRKTAGHTREYLLAGALLVVTLLLYFHSLKNGFVDWDDPEYLRDNPVVHQLGWEQIKAMFTSFFSGNYQPLTVFTYALEYAVSGYRSAKLYHFNNLFLHLVNVLLVFWFIRMISRRSDIAAIVALFFGIHPMHVESVAWISERKDVLYSAFFLAGLISWCYFLRSKELLPGSSGRSVPKPRTFYFLTLLFLFLSLLSKSAAVVFPLVLLLVDFLAARKFTIRVLCEKLPFFALSLIFGIVAMISQGSAIGRGLDLELSPMDRLFTVNYAFIKYIAMLFYPAGLSAYHPYPAIDSGLQGMIIYMSLVINFLLAGAAVYSLKYSRTWFFGVMFFLVNMVLVLQILPVGGAYMAERYTYLSYIGLFFVLASLFAKAYDMAASSSPLRIALMFVLVLFSALIAYTTYQRIFVWKDSLALFGDVVNKYPGNHLAYYLRASARPPADAGLAIEDYTTSISLKADNPKAFNNRGNVYSAGGRYQEALADYNRALSLNSGLTEALNNRGAIKAIFGDPAGALTDIEAAIEIRPDYRDAYRNRGLVMLQMKDLRAARKDWKKAVSLGDELSGKLLDQYPE
jgi:tetratricopeptide (TPR) repeat protein